MDSNQLCLNDGINPPVEVSQDAAMVEMRRIINDKSHWYMVLSYTDDCLVIERRRQEGGEPVSRPLTVTGPVAAMTPIIIMMRVMAYDKAAIERVARLCLVTNVNAKTVKISTSSGFEQGSVVEAMTLMLRRHWQTSWLIDIVAMTPRSLVYRVTHESTPNSPSTETMIGPPAEMCVINMAAAIIAERVHGLDAFVRLCAIAGAGTGCD